MTESAATLLDRLADALRARDLARDGEIRPAAILWTDPRGEWRPLLPHLRSLLPELLVLGEYQSEERTGPAIWLRCLVDWTLSEPALPEERPPILYLPEVARQDLRAGEQCRPALRPLVELQHRGALWTQPNGSDWTVRAFLVGKRSLDLDVAGDQATSEAFLRALPEVAMKSVASLKRGRLEAEDFDRLLSDDVARDMLRWLGDPESTRAALGESRWKAFVSRAREELGFDPEKEADVVAGEKLGRQADAWRQVWVRFEEAPGSFAGIVELLQRSARGLAYFPKDSWPQVNEIEEERLHKALAGLLELPHAEACEHVLELEREHGTRRQWVWTKLGLAPLALALEPLSRLASVTRTSLGGVTTEAMRGVYLREGWQADAASWEAVAATTPATMEEVLVRRVVRHLLGPWLDESARAFQTALEKEPLGLEEGEWVSAPEGGCVFFVDGLRYDLGQRLADRLEARGLRVSLGARWAALPTVTATGKSAVCPVADAVCGEELGADFEPHLLLDGGDRPASAANLRTSLEERGYQVLGGEDVELPHAPTSRGWIESGDIDSLGHKLAGRLPRHLDEELDRMAARVDALLDAGWASVRVVTDHGWLLLPGGLPKVELPKHLTESRWARCATIAGESTTEMPRFAWSWHEGESFATPPGVACFKKGVEYAHGGVSLQECVTPDLRIERGSGHSGASASIQSVTWRGMRCLVEARVEGEVLADLRLEGPSGSSVATEPKPVRDSAVRLLLAGDEHEDAPLSVVLLDAGGTILAHRPTRVGEES